MSCKPYVKTVNANSTSVLANGTVPIGTTFITGYARSAITVSGNTVTINDNCTNGYLVTVKAVFTAPVAGLVTLQVVQNGAAVTGGIASATVTTAATEVNTLSFTTIVKSTPCTTADVLTLQNTGVEATFTNVEFDVIKL